MNPFEMGKLFMHAKHCFFQILFYAEGLTPEGLTLQCPVRFSINGYSYERFRSAVLTGNFS